MAQRRQATQIEHIHEVARSLIRRAYRCKQASGRSGSVLDL